MVAEYNGSGTLLNRYVHGPQVDNPLVWYQGATVTSSSRNSLQVDHQGSVVSVANAAGSAATLNTYDEYGTPGLTNAGRFQYTGQTWIAELGLHYYKARFYSPSLGRFLQTDPIGYEDDLDLYTYTGNDPTNNTDPSGEEDCPGGSTCPPPPPPPSKAESIPVPIPLVPPIVVRGLRIIDVIVTLAPSAGEMVFAAGINTLLVTPTASNDTTMSAKPPKDAKDPKGAKAPGKPGAAEGFEDPKGGEQWVKGPDGRGGWLDSKGKVWQPTGQGGLAHGNGGGLAGSHWDVQNPDGTHTNIYPGGGTR